MKTLTPIKYDKIMPFFYTDYTIAIVNGKAGLIDLEGNALTEFIYDDLSCKYVNMQENSWTKYDNCCSISLNGKWGLIDIRGKILFDFIYDNPIELSYTPNNKHVFLIKVNNQFALFNDELQQLTKFYDKLSFVENGVIYTENKKFGVMDYSGKIVHEAQYDKILHFFHAHKDIIVCQKEGLYGILKTNGEILIDCIFAKLSMFSPSGRYIGVKKRNCNYWGIIDIEDKKLLFDYEFDKIEFCNTISKEKEYVLVEKNNQNFIYKL